MPTRKKYKFIRLSRYNGKTSALDRNIKYANSELKRLVSQMKIPQHIENEASRIYITLIQRKMARGRTMDVLVAASVYIACRIQEVPRTLEEISQYTDINKKEIGKNHLYIMRELGLNARSINPIDLVPRFINALGLSEKTQTFAVELIEKITKANITSGKSPTATTASAIYIASLMSCERRTQREIAAVTGITEVTLRNRYKEVIKKLKMDEHDLTMDWREKNGRKNTDKGNNRRKD